MKILRERVRSPVRVVLRAGGVNPRLRRRSASDQPLAPLPDPRLGYERPLLPAPTTSPSPSSPATSACQRLGPEATDAANGQIPPRVVARIAPLVPPGGTVGILGLAYKPASHVVEAAQGTALAEACAGHGLRVVAFDPLVVALPGRDSVQMAASAAEVAEAADVVVIATPDPAFAALDWAGLLARRPSLVVVDAWRLLRDCVPAEALSRNHVLGRGPTPGADAAADARLASLWTTASTD